MSFQILKAFSHSWSALLFWGPQGAGPVYGEADRRIISLLIMRPRARPWRTRTGGILINKIMSTRWHLRPHLTSFASTVAFNVLNVMMVMSGSWENSAASVFIRVSLVVQIRLWQGEPRSAMWFRTYGGNGVVLTMKTEEQTSSQRVVLWTRSSCIASAVRSIRNYPLPTPANIINLGRDRQRKPS